MTGGGGVTLIGASKKNAVKLDVNSVNHQQTAIYDLNLNYSRSSLDFKYWTCSTGLETGCKPVLFINLLMRLPLFAYHSHLLFFQKTLIVPVFPMTSWTWATTLTTTSSTTWWEVKTRSVFHSVSGLNTSRKSLKVELTLVLSADFLTFQLLRNTATLSKLQFDIGRIGIIDTMFHIWIWPHK